jgi:membrane protein YqaA with SNARE-associated domain
MEKKIKRVLFQTVEVAITLAIIAFFIYSIFNFGGLKDQYTQENDTNYIILFLTAIFLEAAPQLVSVSLILTGIILAGTTPHTAIFIVTAGSFIGSLIGFLVGHLFAERAVELIISEKRIEKEKSRIRKYTDKHGKWMLAILAITPLPYFPVLFGGLKMNGKEFIIYGALIRALSYVMYGYFIYFVIVI